MKWGLSAIILPCTATIPGQAYGSTDIFAPASRLASGKWVKIGISESGIYEIPHEKLRELGFSTPGNVAVFGHGGKAQDEQFLSQTGKVLFDDDMTPVATAHINNKLVFYADGVEQIAFNSNLECFNRTSRNPYTETGYYFITENADFANSIPTSQQPDNHSGNTTNLTTGIDYVYHEKDLQLGIKQTGRIFFGENYTNTGAESYSWDYRLPDLIEGESGKMITTFYLESQKGAILSFGVEGGNKNYAHWRQMPVSSYSLQSFESSPQPIQYPSEKARFFVSAKLDGNALASTDYAHLDYWIATYPKKIPSLSEDSQGRILFNSLDTGNTYSLPINDPELWVLDITQPLNPRRLHADQESTALFSPQSKYAQFILFDPRRKLKTPVCYDDVSSQNLHGTFASDIDLLIITVDKYLSGAQRLAEVHRSLGKLNVGIAEINDIYNEFSSGNPDPMAYRALAKMVYDRSGQRLSNILLLGDIRSDIKSGSNPSEPHTSLYCYQYGNESPRILGFNAVDFYANLDSYTSAILERRKLDVGIGIIPCISDEEIDNYVSKLIRAYSDDTHAYTVNNINYVGGSGDKQLHIQESDNIASVISKTSEDRFFLSPMFAEIAGAESTRKWLLQSLSSTNFNYYLGHATSSAVGGSENIFSMGHLPLLRNSHLPFMAFGACDLTNSDRGQRGVAESMVLTSSDGLIAAMAGMRETFANSNELLFISMATGLCKTYSDPYHTPTLGEIYSYAKSGCTNQNELAYVLIGDPAVPFVLPTNKVKLDSDPELPGPGDEIILKGEITSASGQMLSDFNGEIVARLFSSTSSRSYVYPPTTQSGDTTYYTYSHPRSMLTMAVANVDKGRFSIRLRIPTLDAWIDPTDLRLSFGAYDHSKRSGAGQTFAVAVPASGKPGDPEDDTVPPVIEEMIYSNSTNEIFLSASDNLALNLSQAPFASGLELTVDGKTVAGAGFALKHIDHDRPAYSVKIPLHQLSDGYHQATAIIRDEAGNSSTETIRFISGKRTTASLSLKETLAIDHATVTVSTPQTPRSLTLYVYDSIGKQVCSIPFDGDKAVIDLSTVDLPTGLYHAVARGSDPDDAHFLSEELLIPVFKPSL